MVDDSQRMQLSSDILTNYNNPNNYTFSQILSYNQFRTVKTTFDLIYDQFTWLPGTYGLPYISETDGSVFITTESNFSRFNYHGNKTTSNDTLRSLDLSGYVLWTDIVNVTVPANETVQCNWTTIHGWFDVNVNFTFIDFQQVFVAHYSKSTAHFYRDYFYDLKYHCQTIQTPQKYINEIENSTTLFETTNTDVSSKLIITSTAHASFVITLLLSLISSQIL